MPEQPLRGRTLLAFTAQDLDDSLNAFFSEDFDVETKEGVDQVAIAFINLLNIFICSTNWKVLFKHVRVDYPSFELMVRRFHRDAFGVTKFCGYLQLLEKEKRISSHDASEILGKVKKLGLRVTSEEPRKTKVVAAIALWLSTFRPILIDASNLGLSNETISKFSVCFNFWLTTTYLKKFGNIELGEEDAMVRLERFKHDLMCRAISLSSLEFFFASIFRAKAEQPEAIRSERIVAKA